MTTKQLQAIAREHGTPVVVIDHDIIRRKLSQSIHVFSNHTKPKQKPFSLSGPQAGCLIELFLLVGRLEPLLARR